MDPVGEGGGGAADGGAVVGGGAAAGGSAVRNAAAGGTGGALTVPESGSSRPAARASSVDLPAPFGPTTAKRSPGPHAKETLPRTGVAP